MAPATTVELTHPRQQKCSGVFSATLGSDGTTIDVSCYGVTSALRDSYVDLVEHETQRPPKPDPHAYLQNLSCLGAAVYQQTPDRNTVCYVCVCVYECVCSLHQALHRAATHTDTVLSPLALLLLMRCLTPNATIPARAPHLNFNLKQGTIPAPACLGVEFQRFSQSIMAQQQHSAAHMHHTHDGSSMDHDIELLHAATAAEHAGQQASTSSSSGAALPSSPAEAYMRHAQQQQQQQPQMINNNSTSTDSTHGSGEYHGRPSLVQRLTELHAEASERLDGVDPLWFGKAFVARAALNWDSMKGMAGQMLDAVKADLGFPPSKPSSEGSDSE